MFTRFTLEPMLRTDTIGGSSATLDEIDEDLVFGILGKEEPDADEAETLGRQEPEEQEEEKPATRGGSDHDQAVAAELARQQAVNQQLYGVAQQGLQAMQQQQAARQEYRQRLEAWISQQDPQHHQALRDKHLLPLDRQEMEEQAQQVRQQTEQLQKQQYQAWVKETRQVLREELPDIAKRIADEQGVDAKALRDYAKSKAFLDTFVDTFSTPQEINRIVGALTAYAQTHKTQTPRRARANRQESINRGTHRDDGAPAAVATGATDMDTRISGMNPQQFAAFRSALKKRVQPR